MTRTTVYWFTFADDIFSLPDGTLATDEVTVGSFSVVACVTRIRCPVHVPCARHLAFTIVHDRWLSAVHPWTQASKHVANRGVLQTAVLAYNYLHTKHTLCLHAGVFTMNNYTTYIVINTANIGFLRLTHFRFKYLHDIVT